MPGSLVRQLAGVDVTVQLTVVVVDDRPVVRAGVRSALEADGGSAAVIDGPLDQVTDLVGVWHPDVLVAMVHGHHPAPFRAIATAKGLRDDVHVLVLADDVNQSELRKALLAGADGILLTTAPLAELQRAVQATACGERVVSPEVVVCLARAWQTVERTGSSSVLTSRELEVLRLVAEGLSNHGVAERLQVSPRTVKTHVQNLLGKLETRDRAGAVARGFRLGLLR